MIATSLVARGLLMAFTMESSLSICEEECPQMESRDAAHSSPMRTHHHAQR